MNERDLAGRKLPRANPAENKPILDLEARAFLRLKTAITARAWKEAGEACEELQFGYGWRYSRFTAEFGSERWEELAQEIDAAESEEE